MQFGVKAGEEPAYDPETSSVGGSYIKYFKDYSTTLRILEEINDWTSVWMHFSQGKNRDYPCTDDKPTCPGHNSENEREAKANKRYIVNALNVDTGYVDLYKIPYSIYEDFVRYSDKFGTITDRDYTVYKSKDGNKTSYSVDREDPVELDLSQYDGLKKDHQEALQEAFREVWGALPDEDGYKGLSFDDEPISKGGYMQPIKKEEAPADPPSKPTDQDDGDQWVSEAQLRAMTAEQVLGIFKASNIPAPAFTDKDELVDQLIAALSD